jgi:hypothetical protein
MTDDARQAALAAAFAQLEDPLERWRREAPPAPREVGLDTRPQPDWAAIDERIAAALAEREGVDIETTGQALAKIRKQLRDEIVTGVGQLRAELRVVAAVDESDSLWPYKPRS